jgi:hypothetical protein
MGILVVACLGLLVWAVRLKTDLDEARKELANRKMLDALSKAAEVPPMQEADALKAEAPAKRSHHHPLGDMAPGGERDATGEEKD